MEKKTVAIIHFNTPLLTECAIKSLRKHGGESYRVVVFDNSDRAPFTQKMRGVEVIDNTQGQIIDFDAELEKFPHRDRSIGCAKGCEFGSAKHMMTVQKLWEILPEGFVLMESDILIKRNIDEFFDETQSVVGYCQKHQPYNPFGIGRMLPMLCYMNVPMLTREGARYFDPERTYGLLPGGRQNINNWFDTGAVLLTDILAKRPRLIGRHLDIRLFVEHYGSGSWQNNDEVQQKAWLEQHRELWQEGEKPQSVAICAIGRLENRYAAEWVEHYIHLGVDKIYIYDNNRPEDGECFSDVLQPYIEAGFVEITPWTDKQNPAYMDCYQRHQGEHKWIGFFDFDEFVEIPSGRNIHDLLNGFDFADVLVLNWRVMTDNGLTKYEPKPVKERFTEGTGEDFTINLHVKSFVQNGIDGLTFADPHVPNAPKLMVVNVHGTRVDQVPIQAQVIHDVARIDHYDTKSTEEWVRKVNRGWCDVNATLMKQRQQRSIDYYFCINKRTPEKEAVLCVKVAAKSTSKPKATKRTNKKQK